MNTLTEPTTTPSPARAARQLDTSEPSDVRLVEGGAAEIVRHLERNRSDLSIRDRHDTVARALLKGWLRYPPELGDVTPSIMALRGWMLERALLSRDSELERALTIGRRREPDLAQLLRSRAWTIG